ncbi:MAG: sigma-54-dependent Fis family transcriptional regulator, partial [Desulfuromonas sp.]
SQRMQQLYDLVDNLSQVDTTVLIAGESGTGKELVAESLHYRGPRKGKPLIRVNCAALPENLLESELFGHIKGSFTGAVTDKVGRFQRADGGTIFLDEIGDISPALQVRLLRVLQEKEIEKVGGTTPIKVDIRVVAATHQDLLEKVQRGEFREDLYYRLKVMTVPLPALRERREDIPLLVNFFIQRFNERFSKQILGVSEEVLDLFMQYPWPGNVRELEHAVEHAFILCRGERLERDHLPPDILDAAETGVEENGCALNREQLEQTLEKAAGNKTLAAQMLGISRRTIYRKIEEFALD